MCKLGVPLKNVLEEHLEDPKACEMLKVKTVFLFVDILVPVHQPDDDQPVDHSWKPLPGAKGCHILQLLIGDPGWHKK